MCFKRLMGMVVITSVATLTVDGGKELKAASEDNISIIEHEFKIQ